MAAAGGGESKIFGGSIQGGKENNEDTFFTFESTTVVDAEALDGPLLSSFVKALGVFDGHGGLNGKHAAETARTVSLEFFDRNKSVCKYWTDKEWHVQLTLLFDAIHEAIRACFLSKGFFRFADQTPQRVVRNADGKFVNGGSTGTVVVELCRPDGSSTVISAWVGDSSAMIIFPDGVDPAPSADEPVSATKSPKYRLLTEDHAPENKAEFIRISELPDSEYQCKLLLVYEKLCVPRRYEHPLVWPKDPKLERNPWGHGLHPSNVRYEPATYAVTPKGAPDEACIAVTRALGDFYCHQYGMTHKPEIRVLNLPAGVRSTIVVASDGVWDCWTYLDFCECVIAAVKKDGPVAGTKRVLSESVDRAIASFGAGHYDDASLVSCSSDRP